MSAMKQVYTALQQLPYIHNECMTKCGCDRCVKVSTRYFQEYGIEYIENGLIIEGEHFPTIVYAFQGSEYVIGPDCEVLEVNRENSTLVPVPIH